MTDEEIVDNLNNEVMLISMEFIGLLQNFRDKANNMNLFNRDEVVKEMDDIISEASKHTANCFSKKK